MLEIYIAQLPVVGGSNLANEKKYEPQRIINRVLNRNKKCKQGQFFSYLNVKLSLEISIAQSQSSLWLNLVME
jgi:hypothetical protein